MSPEPRLDLSLPVDRPADLRDRALLAWYDRAKRDLPWRRTKDAYAIWVSEVMLQQTQVATVIPYWERWLARFPTAGSLASAPINDVLGAWQGLGYYRRARMLHQGAAFVSVHGMPSRFEDWLQVPGVGRYTAGAIASIAFGEAVPLVDGNVERVYARLAADGSPKAELHRRAWKWATEQLAYDRPGDWNQALMELGATVCRPVNPLCGQCPVSDRCAARAEFRPDDFPAKEPKRTIVSLAFFVLVPIYAGKLGLRQIPEGQWWHGMWEFPREADSASLPDVPGERLPLPLLKHSVTHHRITLHPTLVIAECEVPALTWFDEAALESLPLPAPQRKLLKAAQKALQRP